MSAADQKGADGEMKKHIVSVILLVASLGVSVLGIYLTWFSLGDYVKTTGVITHVERDIQHDLDITYVEFAVDGKTYSGSIDVHGVGDRKGQSVTVYYDPDDPSSFKGDHSKVGVIVLIIGGVSCLISVISFFYKGKNTF